MKLKSIKEISKNQNVVILENGEVHRIKITNERCYFCSLYNCGGNYKHLCKNNKRKGIFEKLK